MRCSRCRRARRGPRSGTSPRTGGPATGSSRPRSARGRSPRPRGPCSGGTGGPRASCGCRGASRGTRPIPRRRCSALARRRARLGGPSGVPRGPACPGALKDAPVALNPENLHLEPGRHGLCARLLEPEPAVEGDRRIVPEGRVEGEALLPEVREAVHGGPEEGLAEAPSAPFLRYAKIGDEGAAHPVRREEGPHDPFPLESDEG